jgi:membrane protease YdiL (CAAX protease family)
MTKKLNHKYLYLFLMLGLILELPIRYLLSPDPWLAAPDSWYFTQPLRLLIEFIFVVLAISPILTIKEFREKIILNLNKSKLLFILIGSMVSILIFGFLEKGQLQNTLSTASLYQIVIWSLTGFFIGFGQEVTFRGLIYTGLRKKLNFITTNFINHNYFYHRHNSFS